MITLIYWLGHSMLHACDWAGYGGINRQFPQYPKIQLARGSKP